ncbi:unnamed protein product [Nesidiocoris tenuis]|uniref:Uncharacterized protein n=1 Tax=Nesidiocoris tenuis TaxID=355587 RepID=A0A6H5HF74_9HEMI|nr:unnamed protein product [Nesidiocoris tenuis]
MVSELCSIERKLPNLLTAGRSRAARGVRPRPRSCASCSSFSNQGRSETLKSPYKTQQPYGRQESQPHARAVGISKVRSTLRRKTGLASESDRNRDIHPRTICRPLWANANLRSSIFVKKSHISPIRHTDQTDTDQARFNIRVQSMYAIS